MPQNHLFKWGEAGAPLLPSSLRDFWRDDDVPASVLIKSNLPEKTTCGQLDCRFLKDMLTCPPCLEAFLVEKLAGSQTKIGPLLAISSSWPSELDPRSIPWRPRTRNALERAGLLSDPKLLAGRTFADFAAIRGLGSASLLDLSATAEAALSSFADGIPRSDLDASGKRKVKFAKWLQKDAPLLPRSLIEVWRDEQLPDWITQELGLPSVSPFGALAGLCCGNPAGVPLRVERFLVSFFNQYRANVAHIQAVADAWPHDLDAEQIPFAPRTRNALLAANWLSNNSRLSRVTFGELLSLPNLGVKSALDFSATAEAAIREYNAVVSERPIQEVDETILDEVLNSAHFQTISEGDPRFAGLLWGGRGTVFERVQRALNEAGTFETNSELISLQECYPALKDRIRSLSSAPLDVALENFVQALSGLQDQRLEALMRRLGLRQEEPVTLAQASVSIGLTRERLRQLQVAFIQRIPKHFVFMPQLDDALQYVIANSPIDCRLVSKKLIEARIANRPLSPETLLMWAELLHRPPPFTIVESYSGRLVNTTKGVEHGPRLRQAALRLTGSVGISNLAEIRHAVLPESPELLSDEELRLLLIHQANAEMLDESWFWLPNVAYTSSRLYNTTLKMLAVTTPLSLDKLRDGLRREYGRRNRSAHLTGIKRSLVVPPRDVLLKYYAAHPSFVVEGNTMVRCADALDYRSILGRTDQVFVDVLRSTATGLLDRGALWRECEQRGMNVHTFSAFTSYSCVLDHVDTDAWALCGSHVDQAAMLALRKANSLEPRKKRIIDHGWTTEGYIWVTVRIGSSMYRESFVLPSTVIPYLANSSYKIVDTFVGGKIRVTEDGIVSGFKWFLLDAGADEGDLFRLEFALAGQSVTLALGGEELAEQGGVD